MTITETQPTKSGVAHFQHKETAYAFARKCWANGGSAAARPNRIGRWTVSYTVPVDALIVPDTTPIPAEVVTEASVSLWPAPSPALPASEIPAQVLAFVADARSRTEVVRADFDPAEWQVEVSAVLPVPRSTTVDTSQRSAMRHACVALAQAHGLVLPTGGAVIARPVDNDRRRLTWFASVGR